LIGLTDSGKTLLFSRLSSGKYVMTHTSIQENKDQYKLRGSKVTFHKSAYLINNMFLAL